MPRSASMKWTARASRALRLGLLAGLSLPPTVQAAPWLAVGDRGLRSDVELLAAHGLIDGLTTTWPLPAGQLQSLRDPQRLDGQPQAVRLAAARVLAALGDGRTRYEAELRSTDQASVIRDFGSLARDQADVHASVSAGQGRYDAALRVGEQTAYSGDGARFALDGSYVGARLGNWQLYGGWLDQWYGPGWDSSLILSNNARPFPKLGLFRANPRASANPWLHWLGPFQINVFGGVLDGPRADANTGIIGTRFSFAPLHGLEIALSRVTELCGNNHPCNPLKAEFDPNNNDKSVNETNDEATIELKYTRAIGSIVLTPYVQFLNEDTGPFTHSYTSYLFGTSAAGGFGDSAAHWRVIAEYTDTVATLDWFSFGNLAVGQAYNNGGYTDGFRYRDSTLGFSLDSDSRLFSLSGLIVDAQGWTWRAAYRHAHVSSDALAALQAQGGPYNILTTQPARFDQIEAGVSIPWRQFDFDLQVRGRNRQLDPGSGGEVNAELGLRYHFF